MNPLQQLQKLLNQEQPKLKVKVVAVDGVNGTVTVETTSGATFNVVHTGVSVNDYLYIQNNKVISSAKSLTFTEIDI